MDVSDFVSYALKHRKILACAIIFSMKEHDIRNTDYGAPLNDIYN